VSTRIKDFLRRFRHRAEREAGKLSPLPSIWQAESLRAAEAALAAGRLALLGLFAALPHRAVAFPAAALRNWNRPEDLVEGIV